MRSVDSINIAGFDNQELRELSHLIDQEIKRRTASRKKEVLQKIKALAAESGYSLDELMVSTGTAGKMPSGVRSVAAKYCHPMDAGITWTGRGKKPRWVTEALAGGKSLDDLLIAS